MRTIMIPLVLLAATACQKAPSGQPPVTEAQAVQIAEAAEASFTTGDAKAMMAQYGDKAVIIDAASPNPSADRNVQTQWTQTFASMQPADFRVVDRRIQLLGGDAFVSSGVQSFTVAAGAARPTVSARFSDVYQRQKNGSWKIVHEHVSMPPTPAGALAQ
jgi:ketosteroid isomerase-like protein